MIWNDSYFKLVGLYTSTRLPFPCQKNTLIKLLQAADENPSFVIDVLRWAVSAQIFKAFESEFCRRQLVQERIF